MTKKQRIIRIILLTFVTLAFLAVGIIKLSGSQMELDMFTKWGYPIWFMYFTGTCEVLGAIGLHMKRVSQWATLGLIMVTIGAIATHVIHGELPVQPIPATLLMLSLFGILYIDAKKTTA